MKPFLKVGSIVVWRERWLPSASKRGVIAAGTLFRVMRYDLHDFYIQRCSESGEIHKNSYIRKFGKEWLLGKVDVVMDVSSK